MVGSSSKLVRNSRTVDLDLGLLTVDLFDRFGRSMLTSGENRFSSWDCFLESDSVGVISRLNLVYQGSPDDYPVISVRVQLSDNTDSLVN